MNNRKYISEYDILIELFLDVGKGLLVGAGTAIFLTSTAKISQATMLCLLGIVCTMFALCITIYQKKFLSYQKEGEYYVRFTIDRD